jgi:hypothetical protein
MKRGTLANALKLFFGLYAVYVALINVQTAIRLPTMRYYIWAGFGLCLLPVAWGLVRERKWAWNAAAGLLIVQLIWGAGQLLGMYVVGGMTGRTSGVFPVTLQGSLLGLEKSLALIALLIVARRSYQTGFAAVPAGSETKRNSYVRPVALGALFLMIGGLMLLHPIAGQYSPTPLRVVGLALCGLLWAGAVLCFLERRAMVVRWHALFATLIAAAGLVGSMTLHSYFAASGLFVSGTQLVLSITAVLTAARTCAVFVD